MVGLRVAHEDHSPSLLDASAWAYNLGPQSTHHRQEGMNTRAGSGPNEPFKPDSIIFHQKREKRVIVEKGKHASASPWPKSHSWQLHPHCLFHQSLPETQNVGCRSIGNINLTGPTKCLSLQSWAHSMGWLIISYAIIAPERQLSARRILLRRIQIYTAQ